MIYSELPSAVQRRIEFLLNEARLGSERDRPLVAIMRGLSNYATIGVDGDSYGVKMLNTRVSKKAFEALKTAPSLKDWHDKTTNEHEQTLADTWQWLRDKADSLTPEDVWTHFVACPFSTVLKSEDDALTQAGCRSTGSDRYTGPKIEILRLDTSPKHFWKTQSKSSGV